jgi:3-oxoacyl-[acyl-carrier-protein] synthase-3
MRVQITGLGLYAPPRVETAESLAPRVGRSAQWIAQRTGVHRRHFADEPFESMAAKAGRAALGDRVPDLLINASTTPRQLIPDSSVFVARELGLDGIPAFTIHATCLSFVVGLHQAAALVHSGAFRRVLVVSTELASTSIDWSEPESAALLGDGAAAAVVEPTPDGESSALLAFGMRTYPAGAELARFEGAGTAHHPNADDTEATHNLFHMNGPRIFKYALTRLPPLVAEVIGRAGLGPRDFDLVVPHQASGPALKTGAALCGLDPDKLVDVVGEYGNCIAASIPMALAHAHAEGRLHRGDRVLLVGTGAGVSVAALALRW